MKKWLIIFGLIALAIITALVVKGRSGNELSFEQTDSGIYYQDDGGSIKASYLDNPSFDVPIYPGSKPFVENNSANVDINGSKFTVGSYSTQDDADDVVNYYTNKIPSAKTGNIIDFDGDDSTVIYSDISSTSVMVKDSGTQTQIVLIRV